MSLSDWVKGAEPRKKKVRCWICLRPELREDLENAWELVKIKKTSLNGRDLYERLVSEYGYPASVSAFYKHFTDHGDGEEKEESGGTG